MLGTVVLLMEWGCVSLQCQHARLIVLLEIDFHGDVHYSTFREVLALYKLAAGPGARGNNVLEPLQWNRPQCSLQYSFIKR